MKKIIPFKKDIIFKNNISEVTSISLEHTLSVSEEENSIIGEFTVSGEYRMTDESINTEAFSYELPFDIHMDDKYVLSDVTIDIDDFYYEIVNDNVLSVHIDVMVDKIEEVLPVIEKMEEIEEVNIPREDILESEREFMLEENEETKRCIEPEDEVQDTKRDIELGQEVEAIFDTVNETSETYKSYKVYIVREGDDLELIMEKYSITKEELEAYNDLKEIKLGDKIIIPCIHETA